MKSQMGRPKKKNVPRGKNKYYVKDYRLMKQDTLCQYQHEKMFIK